MSKGSFPVTSAQKQIFDAALTAEEQEKLPPPLTPGLYQSIRPPPTGKARRRQQFLEQFDPLNENYVPDIPINCNWFEIANHNNVIEDRVRQVIQRQFLANLNNLLVPQMINKIRESGHNIFKINYSYTYLLKNLETNKTLVWIQDRQKSPWFVTYDNAKIWLEQQEESRLEGENINRPSTKFVFEKHFSVQIKIIFDQQPLQVGEGCLPNWLRTKKGLIAFDNFDDNLCVFRCLAVHYGAHKQHNLRNTRTLETEFFRVHVIPNEIVEFQHIPLIAKYFNQEINVYDVSPEGVFALKGWFKDDEEKEEKTHP